MTSLHAPEHDATFRQSLWAFTVEQVQRIAADRAARASVALWAFHHGAVALEAAQVFSDSSFDDRPGFQLQKSGYDLMKTTKALFYELMHDFSVRTLE